MDTNICVLAIGALLLYSGYLAWKWRSVLGRSRRAESKTSAILDAAVDGIITIDENGRVESFNPAAERIFGYRWDEVVGRNVNMLMPEPYHSEHDGYLAAYKATGKPKIIGIGREVQGRRKDGTTFPMDLAVGESRSDGRRLFAGIVRDITERKRTEQDLRDSEAKTRAILETAVDGIVTIDEDGRILTVNMAAEHLFGYEAAEMVGRNITMLMVDSYQPVHEHVLDRYRTTGERHASGRGAQVEGRRKDGSSFPMELAVGEARVGDGRFFTAIVRDITERKRAEEQLRDSEAKTRAILETAVDAVITINETGRILSANPASERLFGYTAEDMIGHNVNMLMPEPFHSAHDSYLERYHTTGERRIIGIGREVKGRRRDGSVFPMDLAVGEAVVGGSRMFTGIVRDISERKRTEEELRDSEARTRAILDTAVDGIITIDEFGRIQTVNPAAIRLFGYAPAEMIGQNVNMLMPEPYHSEHDGYIKRYRVTGERRIIGIGREVRGLRKDGSTFPMELAVGEAVVGDSRMFTGIVRDISARKKTEDDLRQSEERFRLLVDNVRDYAITWLDIDGRIASWNAGAERIYGWSSEEVIGQPMAIFYPLEARGEAASTLAVVREQGRFEGEGWRVRKDGSRFWAHAVITPLWDDHGNMRGFVRVARDVTERKQAEEALRIAKEEAERAKEEAERANVAKSKFLAAASHDLRQPVQALVFFASALENKIGGSPASAVLSNMKGSLEALNALLDALLDVSRLDAGIVVPRPTNFSLSVLFDQMVTEAGPLAADKKLELRALRTSAIVRTDPMLLGRVVQNLLANAIRYTKSGRILLGCRRKAATLRIEVWDTGIGIPPNRLTDIFQEFYQVGNVERDRSQGLGLGLAIVKRLSRLLDCPVKVRSWEGRGSVFSIEVPLVGYAKERKVSFLDSHAGKGTMEKGVVLVIDDETAVLKGLEMIVTGWGYEVLTATSEAEAFALLEGGATGPDIILADYRLREGHTGAEAILHIRERLGRPIPAVLITGDTAPERLREAEAYGLRLLHKPVQPTVLQMVIAEQVTG